MSTFQKTKTITLFKIWIDTKNINPYFLFQNLIELKTHYNIVIIGGGPAGTSLGIALANLDVDNILILESGDYSTFKIGESIPPNTKKTLKKLGVYDSFLPSNHLPCYGTCSYWGSNKRGYNDSILSPYGHGWHLDRNQFEQFLSLEAQNRGCKIALNSKYINSKKIRESIYEITYQNAKIESIQVSCNFIVDATGSRSLFAQQQGSKKQNTTPIICLASQFKPNNPTEKSGLTHIEATKYGWWYGAKLPNDHLLIGLYTDSNTIKELDLQQNKNWMLALNNTAQTSQFILDSNLIDDKPKGYGAASFCLDKIVGDHWMAIGDAASAYDPITSHGITKSMENALVAALKINSFLSTKNILHLIDFEILVKAEFQNYLSVRQQLYQKEQRWPDTPFWDKFSQKDITESSYSASYSQFISY